MVLSEILWQGRNWARAEYLTRLLPLPHVRISHTPRTIHMFSLCKFESPKLTEQNILWSTQAMPGLQFSVWKATLSQWSPEPCAVAVTVFDTNQIWEFHTPTFPLAKGCSHHFLAISSGLFFLEQFWWERVLNEKLWRTKSGRGKTTSATWVRTEIVSNKVTPSRKG